jgi:myo-inositol-1(or 4)-monophosphatase
MNQAEKKSYLEFAKELALEAGEIMRRYFLATETTWKSNNTPLTQADTEINSLVISRINEAFAGHSVLGEEESRRTDSPLVWVCDPVDGTMPYSHGLPVSSFSLALCYNGVPQLGVVLDPFMNRLFWAHRGGGSYCNDEPLRVNEQGMDNALVSVGAFPPNSPEREVSHCGWRLQEALLAKGASTIDMWSTVLPTCLVAQGKFAATMLNITNPEDGAAIKVIVEEAGGRVTDLFGEEQRYDQPTRGFIASNSVIHDELVAAVKEVSR